MTDLINRLREHACGNYKRLLDEAADALEAKDKEIQLLKTLLVRMTHHEGAVNETETQWLPIVQSELKRLMEE